MNYQPYGSSSMTIAGTMTDIKRADMPILSYPYKIAKGIMAALSGWNL